MSIIHQMLQDLDRRSVELNTPDMPNVYLETQTRFSQMIRILLITSVTVLCLILWRLFFSDSQAESGKDRPLPFAIEAAAKPEPENDKTKTIVVFDKPLSHTDVDSKLKADSTDSGVKNGPTETDASQIKVKKTYQSSLAKKRFQRSDQLSPKITETTAIDTLEHEIELRPRHVDARFYLVKKHLKLGSLELAASLLDEGLVYNPQNVQFITARAQIFLQQKNPQRALAVLQRINPQPMPEVYQSLLAASYNEAGNFQKAAEYYQALLSLYPNKAEYWLGAALANDQLKNFDQALSAYQQALAKNSLDNQIMDYIKLRISLLK